MQRNKQPGRKRYLLLLPLALLAVVVWFGRTGTGFLKASAETTYMIHDAGKISYYTTSATDPEAVLDEVGLVLGIDDTYTTQESNGYTGIFVQRVQMVTINNGGQILVTGSYGETVEALLNRLNVVLDGDDSISADLAEETYDGMEIVINRISNVTEVYSRALAYETEYVVDPELPEGETRILIAGSEGEELCTATVTYEDGREISRSVVTSKVTLAPVNQVVAVGSAVAPEAVSGELYIGNGVIITADGDVLTYVDEISSLATAYTCEGWGRPGITATGTIARVGEIAVDPKYIPYGTRVFIVSEDGEYVYGVATAEDTGHPDFICGYRIDLYMDTEYECIQFGARRCRVYVLG